MLSSADLDAGQAAVPKDVSKRSPGSCSPAVRAVLVALGTLFAALGIIGVILPLVPTTPFILLAAACFARSSRRLHEWLRTSRWFGPTLCAWEEDRTIPRHSKSIALVLVAVAFTSSCVFFIEGTLYRTLVALVGLAVFVFLLSIPCSKSRAP